MSSDSPGEQQPNDEPGRQVGHHRGGLPHDRLDDGADQIEGLGRLSRRHLRHCHLRSRGLRRRQVFLGRGRCFGLPAAVRCGGRRRPAYLPGEAGGELHGKFGGDPGHDAPAELCLPAGDVELGVDRDPGDRPLFGHPGFDRGGRRAAAAGLPAAALQDEPVLGLVLGDEPGGSRIACGDRPDLDPHPAGYLVAVHPVHRCPGDARRGPFHVEQLRPAQIPLPRHDRATRRPGRRKGRQPFVTLPGQCRNYPIC